MENSELIPTYHCSWRQEQRNISSSEIERTVTKGVEVKFYPESSSSVHMDENNKVVVAGQRVITVSENNRNTRFDILRHSRSEFETLKYQAEIKNNDHAMCKLAELYLNGELGEEDVERAHELFLQSASLGNSHAMCKLSEMYESGRLGNADEELAKEWMQKAADKGNVYALGVTGQRLLFEYTEKEKSGDIPEGLKEQIMNYLEKAARKGSTRTMWTIGYIHEKGLLGDQNTDLAIDYYTKAAKNGSPASVESLHEYCQKCLFKCDKLEDILNDLVGRLAKTSIGMLFQLGVSQLNGDVGVNRYRGLRMIEIGAMKNHNDAMEELTQCYRFGITCDANLILCQYWYNQLYSLYQKSANQGNVASGWKLGKFHLKGFVSDINLDKAEYCFKKVVSITKRPEYMIKLGLMYVHGRLGDKDPQIGEDMIKEALLLLEKDAEKNIDGSCYYLGLLHMRDDLSFGSVEKAKYWFTKGSSSGCLSSKIKLSKIYLNKNSSFTDITSGLQILEELILTGKMDSDQMLFVCNFTDPECISWLKKISNLEVSGSHSKFKSVRQIGSVRTSEYDLKKVSLRLLSSIYKSDGVNDDTASDYLYRIFVEFNDDKAMLDLCQFYLKGREKLKHSEVIEQWILNLPNYIYVCQNIQFFFDSVTLIGQLHEKGRVLPLNLPEAAKWYCLVTYYISSVDNVASLNIREVFIPIFKDLYESEYITNDITKLNNHFKSTFLPLYKILSRVLGDIYFGGIAVKRNLDKAIQCYSQASDVNNDRATLSLARIFRSDVDKKNIYRALKYYKLAVKQGSELAITELKSFIAENDVFKSHSSYLDNYTHKSSVPDYELDNVSPFKHLEKYPKKSSEMYDVGMVCLNSTDTSEGNLLDAIYWLRKAEKRGHLESAVELYKIYKSGLAGAKVVPVANIIATRILVICRNDLSVVKSRAEESLEKFNEFGLELFNSTLSALKKLSDEAIFKRIINDLDSCAVSCDSNNIDVNALNEIISYCRNHISNKTLLLNHGDDIENDKIS